MNNAPVFSIIIPVYNAEKHLAKCLKSVVEQYFRQIEIICVNDGSSDSSLEIIKKIAQKDHRFLIIDQKNVGSGPSRNIAIKNAHGKYLAFLDSDDFVEPDWLLTIYKQLISEEVDIIYYNMNYYDEKKDEYFDNSEFIRYNLLPNKKIFSPMDKR